MALAARTRSLIASTVKYAAGILFLTFILPPVIFLLYRNALLADLFQIFLLPLIIAYAGGIAVIYGFSGSGRFVQILLATTVYEALFLDALFISYGNTTGLAGYQVYLFPSFVMLFSFSTAYFGYRLLVDGAHLPGGLYASKSAKYFFFLSVGIFISDTPEIHYFAPIFYTVFILGLVLGTWVFFYEATKNEAVRRFASYLKNSSSKWVALAVILATFYSIIAIPKSAYLNSIIVIAFIILVGLSVFYFIMKVYVLTSKYIDTVTYKVYKKYEYKDDIVLSPETGFLLEAIRQFVMKGDSGRLLIALSSLMTRNEKTYVEIEASLRPIINYRAPDLQLYGIVSLKKMVSAQIIVRNDIVKNAIAQLSLVGEGEKWKSKGNPVQN